MERKGRGNNGIRGGYHQLCVSEGEREGKCLEDSVLQTELPCMDSVVVVLVITSHSLPVNGCDG